MRMNKTLNVFYCADAIGSKPFNIYISPGINCQTGYYKNISLQRYRNSWSLTVWWKSNTSRAYSTIIRGSNTEIFKHITYNITANYNAQAQIYQILGYNRPESQARFARRSRKWLLFRRSKIGLVKKTLLHSLLIHQCHSYINNRNKHFGKVSSPLNNWNHLRA